LSGPADEYFQYYQPLCPLRVDTDEHRYLDIDSSKERFEEFTRAFADPKARTAKGHLIVVTGDKGYGKTSLIQRCAFWLKEQAKPHCRVVDLTDERWSAAETMESRIGLTLDWILDELRDDIDADDVARIKGHSDMDRSFRDLGRVLGNRLDGNGDPIPPIVLAVLLQGYPRRAEVAQYYNLARPGMFFFAEMFEEEEIKAVTAMRRTFNRFGTDASILAMTDLKSGDAKRLVDWILRERGKHPEITRETRLHFDDIIDRYRIGVSELTRLAWGAWRVAEEEAADEVTTTHILKYYAQNTFVNTV
jgi:energy-coupling factor transporter ATP-binding protein EcfA2